MVLVVADVHKKMTSNVSIDIFVCPLVHFLLSRVCHVAINIAKHPHSEGRNWTSDRSCSSEFISIRELVMTRWCSRHEYMKSISLSWSYACVCRVDRLCQTSFLPAKIGFRQHNHSSMVGLITYTPLVESSCIIMWLCGGFRVGTRRVIFFRPHSCWQLRGCIYSVYTTHMYAYLNNRPVTC